VGILSCCFISFFESFSFLCVVFLFERTNGPVVSAKERKRYGGVDGKRNKGREGKKSKIIHRFQYD
jgi:hypothetical protein